MAGKFGNGPRRKCCLQWPAPGCSVGVSVFAESACGKIDLLTRMSGQAALRGWAWTTEGMTVLYVALRTLSGEVVFSH